MTKTALVIGAFGQDGLLLTELLQKLDYRCVPIGRKALPEAGWNGSLTDGRGMLELIEKAQPDEIYYLAAHHHSSEQGEDPFSTLTFSSEVNFVGIGNVLEAVHVVRPSARVFFASSCHVYGSPETDPQNEQTPLNPRSTYAVSKTAGMNVCRQYRDQHGLFTSSGILFPHESRHRRASFLSRRIAQGVAAILAGRAKTLELGDLGALVDWGHAKDHVAAMHLALQCDEPQDYVVGTGDLNSVRTFAEVAFGCAGLEAGAYLVENKALLRRRSPIYRADSSRLRAATGWTQTISFKEMIQELVEAAIQDARELQLERP